MSPLRPRLDIALTALLALAATAAAGCGGGEDAPASGAATEATELPVDGEGMEPRIVTEHPIDAPGRPAEGERTAAAIEAPPGAAWVPHLTAGDLEASLDFYRGLGFEVGSRSGDERVELARDGVRLVLVAAPGPGGREGADDPAEDGTETAAGDDEAPAAAAPLVLHLVEEGGGAGGRTVRDPDGHRVALPGGG